jgi:hypothetical protein
VVRLGKADYSGTYILLPVANWSAKYNYPSNPPRSLEGPSIAIEHLSISSSDGNQFPY